jgi:hypothetical protein
VAKLALLAFAVVLLLPAGPARANCLDNGAGVGYRGNWYALGAADRQARCVEAERRQAEREEKQREREAARDERTREREDRQQKGPAGGGASSAADAERRQQECLVNANACTGPGEATGTSDADSPTRSRRAR